MIQGKCDNLKGKRGEDGKEGKRSIVFLLTQEHRPHPKKPTRISTREEGRSSTSSSSQEGLRLREHDM